MLLGPTGIWLVSPVFSTARRLPAGRRPHVLVVVPCYNYGHFLESCVSSIVEQPGVTAEVHIIDDASTDDSVRVAERLVDRYRDVRLTEHRINRGHIATYNEGLSQADSDYVVLLSADDLLAPGALERATAIMEHRREVGLVYGHPQSFETAPTIREARLRNWSIWKGHDWITAQLRRGLSIIYSPEAVVRTSVHHEAGYYRPELPHSGDLEMWLRIAEIADVARVNGPDQAYRRVHQASMMQTNFSAPVDDLEHRRLAYESFLTRTRVEPAKAEAWRKLAAQRLASEALGLVVDAVRTGSDSSEQLGPRAIAFATAVDPDVTRSPLWRDCQKLLGVQAGDLAAGAVRPSSAAWARAIQRDLEGRMRWRRWRRYGY